MAEDRDWITVSIEANTVSPFRDALARALCPVLGDLRRSDGDDKLTKALATFKAFSVKVDIAGAWSVGLDIASARGGGEPEELEADLGELIRDLTEAAQEQGGGLAILINEAQELTQDDLKRCARSVTGLTSSDGRSSWRSLVCPAFRGRWPWPTTLQDTCSLTWRSPSCSPTRPGRP